MAPIPLLVLLGALIGNKVQVDCFQRHRDTEDWCWKTGTTPIEYVFRTVASGSDVQRVALVLSLSGRIARSSLPEPIDATHTIYEITLADVLPSPTFLRLREDLARFAMTYRDVLAQIRAHHPGLCELHVFAAVPAPVAVMCGRELLPKVDPVLRVYDFDKTHGFTEKLKVNSHDPQ